MTPIDLANALGLQVANQGGGDVREVSGIYCGDLLSIVMSHAQADNVWITVMANVNTLAVAELTDVACVILSEGMSLDDSLMAKAKEQEICILQTDEPTFETALAVWKLLEQS